MSETLLSSMVEPVSMETEIEFRNEVRGENVF
jgi:hypothetical protein